MKAVKSLISAVLSLGVAVSAFGIVRTISQEQTTAGMVATMSNKFIQVLAEESLA